MPPQSRTRRLSPAEQVSMRRRDDEELRRRDTQTEAILAQLSGLRPIPSHKSARLSREGEYYDYNAAIAAGYGPDDSGHWPSDFKLAGHPNTVVGGFHVVTAKRVPGTRRLYGDDLVAEGWDKETVKELDAVPEPIVSPMPSHTTPSPDAYQGDLNDVLLGGRDAAIRAPTRSERAWGMVEDVGEGLPGPLKLALGAVGLDPQWWVDRRATEAAEDRQYQAQIAGLTDDEIVRGIMAGTVKPPVSVGVMADLPGLGAAHRIVSPRHRPSRAENVALGLYHPVGEGKKLRVPVTEMTSEYMPSSVSMADTRTINPASMEGGAIIPATGDRSRAGTRLTAVGSTPLDQPVLLEGGPDFMRTHASEGAAWASTKNALTKLANRSRQASEASLRHGGTGDVYMVYMPQDHAAVDFSAMMSDALMAQIAASKVTRRSGAAFDRVIKNTRPEWKGIFHPGAKEQLAQSGELRHEFVNAMKLDEFAGRGFPDVTATRTAIIEPALMDIPSYHGGFSVAKIDPAGRVIDAPAVPHRTYNTQLAGEYAGRLPGNVPPDAMFPDFYRSRRAAGKPPSRDIRSFLLSNPIQIATPAWVRENADFLARTGAVTALLVAGKESTPVEE